MAGEVALKVTVTQSGRIKEVETLRGHPLLVQAAADAIRAWKFAPLHIGPVHFELHLVFAFHGRESTGGFEHVNINSPHTIEIVVNEPVLNELNSYFGSAAD
jgi:TonB family protein